MGAVLVGVVAGPLIAVGYTYLVGFRIRRALGPMVYIEGTSYLSVLMVGAVVGLFLGVVGGYLYKHYAAHSWPGPLGLIQRNPWKYLLGAWLIGIPLRSSDYFDLIVLGDLLFAAGVIMLITGYLLRVRDRMPKQPS